MGICRIQSRNQIPCFAAQDNPFLWTHNSCPEFCILDTRVSVLFVAARLHSAPGTVGSFRNTCRTARQDSSHPYFAIQNKSDLLLLIQNSHSIDFIKALILFVFKSSRQTKWNCNFSDTLIERWQAITGANFGFSRYDSIIAQDHNRDFPAGSARKTACIAA